MNHSLKTNKSIKIAKKTEEEEAVKFYKMLSSVIKKDEKNKNKPDFISKEKYKDDADDAVSISKEENNKNELIEADFIYTTNKIRQHDPYFFKFYINKNDDQLGIEELLHEAENAIKVSEITNDDDAIALVNQIIKVEYNQIRTSITIKEALNCLKLQSALESIRTGIGIQVCLKDFGLFNGLEDKIREFIHQRNDDYHIIIFQFSNFLFYYLKNLFEYSVGKSIGNGHDEDFCQNKPDEATNMRWIGYECRDKYPKNKNHSKKRP
ncbi:13368_t:CDS:2, partial [Racocetra persica]